MFGLFKKKKDKGSKAPMLADLNGNPLKAGDKVEALRYDLGTSKLVEDEEFQFVYESLETKKKVNWLLMVDAATSLQKVRKIEK